MMDNNFSEKVSALILCGGHAKRLNGIDKGLLQWQGKFLVKIIIDELLKSCSRIMINANHNINRYAQFSYPIISDEITGYAGPLAGIHAGLQQLRTEYLLIVPCDCPFFKIELAHELYTNLINSANKDIAVASHNNQIQPLFLLLNARLLAQLERYLSSGQRKAGDWILSQDPVLVNFSNEQYFININTYEDERKHLN
ncbi:MAG: molybdenum cofactor guanylyltransferase [Gammaproteobacteria bacterium]|nr:molybdenum cofactor guanylyltransferase [Gammaproteobacteria bacterium]